MPALHTAAVPVEVERVRQRIERWRQARVPGAPIPPALWAAAAKAAQRHGVARTTRALGLDYNKLKSQVQAVAGVEPARFVELAPLAPALVAPCRIEIEGASGTRIKIELPAAAGAQLAMALCQSVGAIAR